MVLENFKKNLINSFQFHSINYFFKFNTAGSFFNKHIINSFYFHLLNYSNSVHLKWLNLILAYYRFLFIFLKVQSNFHSIPVSNWLPSLFPSFFRYRLTFPSATQNNKKNKNHIQHIDCTQKCAISNSCFIFNSCFILIFSFKQNPWHAKIPLILINRLTV